MKRKGVECFLVSVSKVRNNITGSVRYIANGKRVSKAVYDELCLVKVDADTYCIYTVGDKSYASKILYIQVLGSGELIKFRED